MQSDCYILPYSLNTTTAFYIVTECSAVAYEAGGRGAAATTAWKIQGKLCFQGKIKLLKNPER